MEHVSIEAKFKEELERYEVSFNDDHAAYEQEDGFRLVVNSVDVMPLGVECVIAVRIGERELEGVVPSLTVGFVDGQPIVPGAKFLLDDNKVKVMLPASSMGTYTWVMSEDEMKEVEFVRR